MNPLGLASLLLLTNFVTVSKMLHFLATVSLPAKVRYLYLPSEPHEFVVKTKRDNGYMHV